MTHRFHVASTDHHIRECIPKQLSEDQSSDKGQRNGMRLRGYQEDDVPLHHLGAQGTLLIFLLSTISIMHHATHDFGLKRTAFKCTSADTLGLGPGP